MTDRERELSFEERILWGRCPVCGAEDGAACDASIGLNLTMTAGAAPPVGAHLGRLQNAPFTVIEVGRMKRRLGYEETDGEP